MATALLERMENANYFAMIDSLCADGLAAEHDESDDFMAGRGYRIVSLAVSHGSRNGDGSGRSVVVDDFHALKDHMSRLLNCLWGDQHPLWWMGAIVMRIDRGEVIPEPWATLSTLVDEVDLWQPPGTNRWLALGVADRDFDDEVHLLAVVTDTDPP